MTSRVKVVNPRYAGATPEDVARALLRPLPPASRSGGKTVRGDQVPAHEPSSDQGSRDGRHLRDGV